MRRSRWFFALAAVAAIASGCGSAATSSGPGDAGVADVTLDRTAAVSEAAAEAAPADAGCVVDADIEALSLPDAAPGDAGLSTGGCVSCIREDCNAELVACAADCACTTDVLAFLACTRGGGSTGACGAPLVTGSSEGFPLAQCVLGRALGGAGPGCSEACGFGSPGGPTPAEGGADASAPAEGGADASAPPAEGGADASAPPAEGGADAASDGAER